MNNVASRTIYIDIESAGRARRAPIIELAAIAVESGSYRELDSIDMKLEFAMKEADPRFLGVNKFSPTVWEKYALPERDAAAKLAAFLRRHATTERTSPKTGKPYLVAQLAGFNSNRFDIPRLEQLFQRHKLFFPACRRSLCVMQKTQWFFEDNQALQPGPDNFSLAALADYFRLATQPDHTALSDVRATVELARLLAEFHRISATAAAA
ncbi:3'-5' exonuclease [Bythopirellula goksoeyrii]|nr:exonuclease domain-containing protein [Bythopirellula goksoeyrii]